jgi:SAM-dependent methyltransferase
MELEAHQFCDVNATYRRDYRRILGLSDPAMFPVLRCDTCGFCFSRAVPSQEFLVKVYDEVIETDANARSSDSCVASARRMSVLSRLIGLCPRCPPVKLLDYGCGLGGYLRLAQAAQIPAVGFEFSLSRTETVRETGVTVVGDRASVTDAGPYDVVICDNVLEHVPDPVEVLRYIASLTMSDGVLFLSVPTCGEPFMTKQRERLQAGVAIDKTLNPWEHLNYFTAAHLDRMAGQAGFARIPAFAQPPPVDIGIRAEANLVRRAANATASAARLLRYAVLGTCAATAETAFYRFGGRRT